jgi:hypothetical protein
MPSAQPARSRSGPSREGRLAAAGAGRRIALGAFALIGAAILTGVDHRLESIMIAAMPDWLTSFATAL